MNYTRVHLSQHLDQYPELKALQGVTQPERWHPEGDAFEHTLLVVDQQQARYPYDPVLNLAAVCHDFGKALTPKDKWPKHYGHADLGIKPSREFLDRLDISNDVKDIVLFLVKYHMHMHQVRVMNHKTYLKLYIEASKLAVPTIVLSKLAKLGVCDHYGRGGVDPNERYVDPFIFISIMREFEHNDVTSMNQKEQLEFAKKTIDRMTNVD